MTSGTDAFLAELGLRRADHAIHPWGNGPGSKIQRACLNHTVMSRMLEGAEQFAPSLNLSREVVFALLRDLVIEEAERSPFGLVGRDPESEPANAGSMSLNELLTEAAKLTDARHGPPRAPEWAVALDAENQSKR